MQQNRFRQPDTEHLVVWPHRHFPAELHTLPPPSPARLRAAVLLIYVGLVLTLMATLGPAVAQGQGPRAPAPQEVRFWNRLGPVGFEAVPEAPETFRNLPQCDHGRQLSVIRLPLCGHVGPVPARYSGG